MPASPDITGKDGRIYKLARLTADNLGDLETLYAAVYRTEKPTDYFQKKYNTVFAGVSYVGYIAYDSDGMPAAYYGVIPCFICSGDQKILSAQSADTMTHPQHRHQGLFVELSKRVLELCPQLGIRFVFGFPNNNAYPAMVNQLGWRQIGIMDSFRIEVSSLPFGRIVPRIFAIRNIYEGYFKMLLGKRLLDLQGIENSVTAAGFAGLCRDQPYLEYKTLNPSMVIAIRDCYVWLNRRNGMMLGDFKGLNEENFPEVIRELKRVAAFGGLNELQFHCSSGTPLHSLFSKHFEPIPSYPILYHDFGSKIPAGNIKFTFADIDIF